MAEDALKAAAPMIGKNLSPIKHWFKPNPTQLPGNPLSVQSFHYLAGRYGQALPDLIETCSQSDLTHVNDLDMHWAELAFNARFGMIEHLDDLLLRHTRLGLLLPDGAIGVIQKVKELIAPHLSWSEEIWQSELSRYQDIYLKAYNPNPENHLKKENYGI